MHLVHFAVLGTRFHESQRQDYNTYSDCLAKISPPAANVTCLQHSAAPGGCTHFLLCTTRLRSRSITEGVSGDFLRPHSVSLKTNLAEPEEGIGWSSGGKVTPPGQDREAWNSAWLSVAVLWYVLGLQATFEILRL